MTEMTFEWDEKKSRINRRKHVTKEYEGDEHER